MKKLALLPALWLFTSLQAQDTYSIVAVDPATGWVGSAGASCIGAGFGIPDGCIIISDVHPGVGAIHTQAYYLGSNKTYASSLMDLGLSPQQIIDSLVANDAQNNPQIRQYGVVDFTGSAAFTGSNCDDYKNHILGSTYAIQGNILLGQHILDSMEMRFLNTDGTLACKLMAALQAANVPGADTRCLDEGLSSLSAFIRVALPGDALDAFTLDLNVKSVPNDWSVDPIDSLQKLFEAAVGCVNVAVPEAFPGNGIDVFPQPASGRLLLETMEHFRSVKLVSLAINSPVYQMETGGSVQHEIDCRHFPRGMYLLKVRWKTGNESIQKVLLQ